MNRSLAIAVVLVGLATVAATLTWVTLTVNEAQRDLEDGVVMPHSGPTGVLYRHSMRIYMRAGVRAKVRREQMEKK